MSITPELPNDPIPPTSVTFREVLELSGEILRDIELATIPLANAVLKTIRLARLLNDFDRLAILQFEAGGYPVDSNGNTRPDAWEPSRVAGRRYTITDPRTTKVAEYCYTESVEQLEQRVGTLRARLSSAVDANVSISSANPYQWVMPNQGNLYERAGVQRNIELTVGRLAERRNFLYEYVSRKHYELKFSNVASDIFARRREAVDNKIGLVVPDAIRKFDAVNENLRSDNPEDWANAVHSCRRILQALADALFPPQKEARTKDGNQIKLGSDSYINRLICFAEDKSASNSFRGLVGSHLGFLGDRLDAVFEATQKGSHADVSREEADRYVIYTYLVVGDILSLIPPDSRTLNDPSRGKRAAYAERENGEV